MPKKRHHGDGALYKLKGRDLWRGVLDLEPGEDGKRRQKYVHARTQRECRDKLDALKAEIAEFGAPIDKRVTVAAWARTWLETVAKPNVDPNTYTGYKSQVNRWIIPTIGRLTVAKLKPSDAYAVRDAILKAGRSSSTARQAHIVLSQMLDAAKAERLCSRNICDDVKRTSGAPREARGAFTTEQALSILHAAALMPGAVGSRWWFKLLCGPRQGEILGASLSDLHLDEGYYKVNWKLEELTREHGCGTQGPDKSWPCGYKQGARCPDARWRVPVDFESVQLDGRWHLTRPKSNTGREIPIIPQLAEAIRRYLKATEGQPNPHGLVWHNPDGSIISNTQDDQEWRELLVAAGIITPDQALPGGTKQTGHWARHTAVTALASLGVDHQLIGQIMGQSSVKVTEMYRHVGADERKRAAELLGAAFAPAIGAGPGA